MIRLRLLVPVVIALMIMLPEGYEVTYDTKIDYYMSSEASYDDVVLRGMILPHHLVPLDKIARLYETASNPEIKTIILLSPDHFSNSKREILVSKNPWYGDFGAVYTDQKVINQLLRLDFVYEDSKEIEIEHGLNTHIPFIAHYFEHARVVPLAVNKLIKRSQLDELLSILEDDVFIIASVDFSHYYPKEEADAYDEITKSLMYSGNYESFFQMSDAYFDTPGVLYLALSFAKEFVIYDQANAADYMGEHIQETTSYFFIGLK